MGELGHSSSNLADSRLFSLHHEMPLRRRLM